MATSGADYQLKKRALRQTLTDYLRVGYARPKQRAATVLQPEQYRAGQGWIRSQTKMPETAQISGIS
jgi:hypothetical protein